MDQGSLIASSAEAQAFLAESRRRIGEFLLYPSEEFAELSDACLSCTGVDLQGEATTVEDLERIVKRIEEGPFWTTIYHNPRIHPIGRVLIAKIFKDADTGTYFVAALAGYYDRTKIRNLSNTLDPEFKANIEGLADQSAPVRLSVNPFELPADLIQDLLADAPAIVDHQIHQERRKSAEALLAILRLVVPAGFFFGVAKKGGEKGVELLTEELFRWIKNSVAARVSAWSRENNRQTLLILESDIHGCVIEFVTSLRDEFARIDAASKAYEAFDQSISIVQQLAMYRPTRLVLEYDEGRRRYLPLYLVTQSGIFTDRPYLEAIRARGLSLASRAIATQQKLSESDAQPQVDE